MLMADRKRVDAQVFYGDAFVAFTIFLLAVVTFFALSPNASSSENRVLDALVGDAESISASLMTAGTPADWTQDTVRIIGLTDGAYRVDYSKVSLFYNVSLNSTNNLFGTNSNYLVFFKDRDGNILPFDRCAFSNAGIALNNITLSICENVTLANPNNLVSIERLVFYQSQIIKLVIYVWV